MKQVLQDLQGGRMLVEGVPAPLCRARHLRIATSVSLISAKTGFEARGLFGACEADVSGARDGSHTLLSVDGIEFWCRDFLDAGMSAGKSLPA
jgi:hypothetical protein